MKACCTCVGVVFVSHVCGPLALAAPVGTAFTYQGVLENPPGQLVNDTCAFEFALCDDANAACAPGTLSSHAAIDVTFGVFTVPDVDFGDNACHGEARWMEISVQCSGDAMFTTLSPRVELTPAPYALRAIEGVGPDAGIHVAANGNVGVGTATPATKLHVAIAGYNGVFVEGNGTGDARFSLENGGGPHFIFDDQSDAHALKIESASERALAFNTNGAIERMRIDPAGNVGIGTNAPQAQLDVNGAARATTVEITGGSPIVSPLPGWGLNDHGQIDVPSGVHTAVAAGGFHSLAIASDGTLVGWGDNTYGQSNVLPGTYMAVAAGYEHSCAIRSDGTLVGWGRNQYGQASPVPSGSFIAVSAGANYCVAIRNDGALAAWGLNNRGQRDVPAGTFTAVSAGYEHALAIRTNGQVVGWGFNSDGQIDIPAGTYTTVAGGYRASFAIRDDGTLAGWGYGPDGLTNVPAGTFKAVAASFHHCLAIRTDDTLFGWGDNNYGQTSAPSGTFIAVAVGDGHSLAIRIDPPETDPALRLLVDSAFKPGSNTWTIYSDRRLKKDIEPLGDALERLTQLHGRTFRWREPLSQGGDSRVQMGLIADEVQKVFPQWVGRDAKGYQTLTVGGFEALTAEAVRELREEKDCEIEDLKSQISDFQSQISDLKEMVKALSEKQKAESGKQK